MAHDSKVDRDRVAGLAAEVAFFSAEEGELSPLGISAVPLPP